MEPKTNEDKLILGFKCTSYLASIKELRFPFSHIELKYSNTHEKKPFEQMVWTEVMISLNN